MKIVKIDNLKDKFICDDLISLKLIDEKIIKSIGSTCFNNKAT